MSSYKKRLVKNHETVSRPPVHVDDRASGPAAEYVRGSVEAEVERLTKLARETIEDETARILVQVEEDRKRSLDKGYSEGYEAGRDAVKVELMKELEAEFQKASDVYEQANLYKKEVYEEIDALRLRWMKEKRKELGRILSKAVEGILKVQVEEGKYDIVEILKEAMAEVESADGKIWVKVHPEVYGVLRKSSLFQHPFEWISDPRLEKCDVEIETPLQHIESRSTEKIKELRHLIEGVAEKDDQS